MTMVVMCDECSCIMKRCAQVPYNYVGTAYGLLTAVQVCLFVCWSPWGVLFIVFVCWSLWGVCCSLYLYVVSSRWDGVVYLIHLSTNKSVLCLCVMNINHRNIIIIIILWFITPVHLHHHLLPPPPLLLVTPLTASLLPLYTLQNAGLAVFPVIVGHILSPCDLDPPSKYGQYLNKKDFYDCHRNLDNYKYTEVMCLCDNVVIS